MGWEIYPEGLYRVGKTHWDRYRLPICITENGICYAKDEQRTAFIYEHLRAVKRLIDHGVPVERYYYWSLIDNFEWEYGLEPRFGLIEVDYDTQERTIRESGFFYGNMAEARGVTKEMIKR